ncbi:hypothetical protein GQ457_06G009870 [Hibiscus cannabinus]
MSTDYQLIDYLSLLVVVERSDLDNKAGENIIGVMYVRVLFNDVRIPTFLTDGVQRLPFPDHVNFIARLVRVPHRLVEFPFARLFFAAADDQQDCHEQSTVPRNLLGRFDARAPLEGFYIRVEGNGKGVGFVKVVGVGVVSGRS